ncbi:Nucleolar pre-ribosomal-associated protein 1, N-terminal [Kalmanozyma brasiliensis GHG001]|uniref:Uncharacterized protein n=1 Tax=Kalmanozyma brasiliensis (strain GHG001) TaxID=1365824 RepID=V5F016_KALBG|nr:Nucleolar pre-ribosomal-associated protein 1, N-terminal [Kalmanozyma brasiliensis GHG001]EST09588.1 Nucleolar pre-ribosomal-associated protein 1, N-terminal [Kalmanozyma brasiliensis GHG001]
MVDKRKRASSDAASASNHDSDAEQSVGGDQPGAQEANKQNKAFIPFAHGAELHDALKTPSADLLRLLLTRFRHQTTLSFAENTQRSVIPANDKRIQLVRDYAQLCETSASGSSSSGAASIFSTWELADRQDLPTLLHLPIFCLAQSLALLSIHYPTQALGSNIIERLLSANEPWLDMLHSYISNLGGAKYASSKQRESRTSKGSDVAALASLVLLREIVNFAQGRHAVKLFDSFNWSMKVLPHIFNMRRRANRKSKTSKKAQVAQDVSLRRPDIRTLYILFLLSFLQQSYSHTLKLRLLDLGRDFLPAILKGLPQDPPDVVQIILLHLHEDLIKDQKIPRSKKVEFWNEWACGCVVQLYSREEEHVLIHADTDTLENPSVADLAHHFLLSICTNPGFGICYPDRGWYPRKAPSKADVVDEARPDQSNTLANGIDHDESAVETKASQKSKQAAGGGAIYNKVLSGVLRQLSVAEDLRQQELALGILTACPELVGGYLESSCAGLSVEPRPSSRWLCNMAFFGRVVGLELPSFRNAKVEHLESSDDPGAGTLAPQSHRLLASEPPPMSSILANILPGPFHRSLFSQGLNSSDRLVRYSTCTVLCRCLDRMVHFRNVCSSAITELDEDEDGSWRKRLDALELEARKRIPDISVIIQILQVATSRSSINDHADANDAQDQSEEDTASAITEKDNMILTEIALRLLSLYYQAVPSSAFDVRFNAGKLLTNAFIYASSADAASQMEGRDTEMANGTQDANDGATDSASNQGSDDDGDEEDSGEVNLEALCQVHTLRILSHSTQAASFDWTAKPTGSSSNLSYLGLLLTLYVSTPLPQVKQACEDLIRSLLSSSSFFEHHPSEIEAWLASLPQFDTRTAQSEEQGEHDSVSVATHHPSVEQSRVISFLDECMLRCAKTPYRYIEAARQLVRDHGSKENASVSGKDSNSPSDSTDLLASPWLMAIFEQFTIRVEKGLFGGEDDTVGALSAFFVRLLPVLCGYTRQTSAVEAMSVKIHDAIKGSPHYSSSVFLASTLISKIHSIRTAPELSTLSTKKSKRASSASSALFLGSATPQDLKIRLRDADRPLTQVQVSELYQATQKLHAIGFSAVSQILEELDPATENLAAAAFSGSTEIAYGTVPILHLPLNVTFTAPPMDDFMATDSNHEAQQAATLVAWRTEDLTRLAIRTAVDRSRKSQDSETLLHHVASLLSIADASGQLSEGSIKHFLFADVVSSIDALSGSSATSGVLLRISELAVRHLVPSRKEDVEIVTSLIHRVEQDQAFDGTFFRSMTNLMPFLPEDHALDLIETFARALETREPEAGVSLLAAEALAVLVASLQSRSAIWKALALRLPELVSAALRSRDNERSGSDASFGQRQHLLFGSIQSILEHVQRDAKASLPGNVAGLNFSDLSEAEICSSAMDGALVAAIHAHPKLASSVSGALMSILSSTGVMAQQDVVRTLPCTLLTLLSALLEQEEAELSGQEWTQAQLQPVVDLASTIALEATNSADALQKLTSLLIVSLRCARKFGWTAIQTATSSKLLEFTSTAAASLPSRAFHRHLLQVLLGLIEHIPDLPRLTEILQATVDASLLWLVRRFAEDSNDTVDLVQTITLFTSLVQRIGGDEGFAVQLKKSLVDPVIQAAIKNRLRGLDQMQLVLALCSYSDLGQTDLSRYLGALSAHSDFNSVLRGTATIQRPTRGDTVDDEEEQEDALSEREKHDGSQHLREALVEVVYTVASRDAKALLRAPLLTKLMSFYGASLSKSDRMLLSLFRMFEEECGHSFTGLVQGWTLPSSQSGGASAPVDGRENTLEALQSLDANVVFATCTEYPRSLSLRNTMDSGFEDDDDEAALSGQVYGRHTDAALRYDPVFVASLLAGVSLPDVKLSKLQWMSVFATNAPGLVVCGLSSRCADMRRASLTLTSNLYLAIREADFQEKDHLIMVLDLLRDALDSTTSIQATDSETPSDAPYLPITTTLFIAHALRSITTPSSFIYPIISHFLLQRPQLDVGDIPLLYNLLYTASDKYKQERMWMLRFLRDVARSGGRSDWKIFKRRRTWELLASMYDSCDGGMAGASMSAERAVEETAMRALIEDTTAWLVRKGDVAIELVTRRGLLTWMWQQAVREGVVAMAESRSDGDDAGKRQANDESGATVGTSGTLRSVWMLLLVQLVRSVDLDRLHRATDAAWLAPTLTLTLTTVKALHNCRLSSPSTTRTLPTVSADLARTISCTATMVLDRVLLFAEDPSMGMWMSPIIEILDKILDIAEPELAHSNDDAWQQCCVRIQRCALTIAPTASSSPDQQRLAKVVRRSTALCRRFDSETATLVVSNLFTS